MRESLENMTEDDFNRLKVDLRRLEQANSDDPLALTTVTTTVANDTDKPFDIAKMFDDLSAYRDVMLEMDIWHASAVAAGMSGADRVVNMASGQFLLFLIKENELRLAAGLKSTITREKYDFVVERWKADPRGKVFEGLLSKEPG
jgi:hypothetical protein